jgi:hypothetical protein
MPENTAEWKEGAHTELARRLARQKQGEVRGARSSLASQGALYSGARQERERQVEQDVGERWLTGAEQIESRAETARQSELGREWQTGERVGGEEAQRALESDKAYYQSYLQDQIQSGRLTEQQAAQEFEAYSMQADQQFAYSQMLSQQQYGYGMQNLQGEWDAYGQTLGFQNQAGLLGMQQDYGWQLSQSDQMFRQGMASYGWEIQQAQNQFQKMLVNMGGNIQRSVAGIANDSGFWDYFIEGLQAAGDIIPG